MAHVILVWLSVQSCDEENDTVSLTLPVLQQWWPEVVALQCPRVSTCAGLKELKGQRYQHVLGLFANCTQGPYRRIYFYHCYVCVCAFLLFFLMRIVY